MIDLIRNLLATIIFVFIYGCTNNTINTQTLIPAESDRAAQFRRIAILPFEGHYENGVVAQSALESDLANLIIEGQPYFEVVERYNLDQIIDEQRLSNSGLIALKDAIKLGKLAGVQAVIMGTVTEEDINHNYYTEKREVCTRVDPEKNGCVKWHYRDIRCTELKAIYAFTPKFVDVKTGVIVASENISAQQTSRSCPDWGGAVKSESELMIAARANAVDQFSRVIAPHYSSYSIHLLDKDDTKLDPAASQRISSGLEFARNNRLDRACQLWNEAHQTQKTGYLIHYLLGICAETSGNLKQAQTLYIKADQFAAKPIYEIGSALERIDANIFSQSKLNNQLSN